MLSTILWALGIIGVPGVALFVASLFVPTIAVALKAALDFLRSPLGQIICAVAVVSYLCSASYVGGDLHGSAKVRAAWRAEVAGRAQVSEQKQEAADKSVDADVTAKLQQLEQENIVLKQKVQDALANHPVCRLDSDTARRLRLIQ